MLFNHVKKKELVAQLILCGIMSDSKNLRYSKNDVVSELAFLIENGGDLFLKINEDKTVSTSPIKKWLFITNWSILKTFCLFSPDFFILNCFFNNESTLLKKEGEKIIKKDIINEPAKETRRNIFIELRYT